MLLSTLAVKNAKPKDKPFKISDGQGLYLLVKPNGGKYWRYKYSHLGKEKLLALGTFPEISLLEARDKRAEARKLLAEGKDPSSKRQHDKRVAMFMAENTFGGVAREWFETNQNQWTKSHAQRLWRRIEANFLPTLGSRPIGEISSLELLSALRDIEKRGATELSHRLLQCATRIFSYAILTERMKANPAFNLKGALKPHVAENFPTIQAKELPRFFDKLAQVETSPLNKYAIRLLMLTFVRQGEMRQACWDDIDWTQKRWVLPAHTTKMRDEHIVPLAAQTITLLREIQSFTGGRGLLFPTQQRRKHGMMSENTVNHVLHKMGYKGVLVGHGFRALASTTLNEMGYSPDVIERQLAHAERNKIRAAYNRAEYLPERQIMMQKWADFLDEIRATEDGKVVTIANAKVRGKR
jgi:integrase